MIVTIPILLFVLLQPASFVLAQRQTVPTSRSPRRVGKDKPTVYIAFDKALDSEKSVVLELRNNTSWTLHYYLTPESVLLGLPVLYNVEGEPGLPSQRSWAGDVVMSKTIAPKGIVRFVVPFAHLAKGYRIYIPFHYGWEEHPDDSAQPFRSEPTHRVYFSHLDLARAGVTASSEP